MNGHTIYYLQSEIIRLEKRNEGLVRENEQLRFILKSIADAPEQRFVMEDGLVAYRPADGRKLQEMARKALVAGGSDE